MVVPITELAVGYVSISASTRGMGAQIDREMRGIQSKGATYGRGLGDEVKKGFEAAKPVDTKQIEQNFTDSEKRREAVVKRTTESVETARRKEEIATAKLSETEKKYAAGSSQVLAAKDRLAGASQRVQMEEAKQSVAVDKATRDVADAKRAVDDLASAKDAASTKAKGFGAKIGDSFRGIGRDAGEMGREVGQSFAKIGQGDFKGAFSGLKAAFGITAREGKAAGVETGERFSTGAAGAFKSAGTAAGNVFIGTLKGILGAQIITKVVSGFTGLVKGAFKGGFDRIMNIQEAEIKLGTIFEGDAVKVKAAMKSVADSVDGTKFAISDAADMASQLGAAGVDAGPPMQKWLERTADAAQFAGREFSDMQSIIGKVVATGKVTGETFEQLPLAAAALSDHLGISQGEVRKLASEGKISAEQFGEAMDKKIGGAAKDAGGSFLSMIANIKSATNATGAKLLKPITDALMPIAGVGLTLVKGFRDNVAGPMGEALSEFLQPKAEAFAESLKKLPGFFSGVRDSFANIKSLVTSGDFKGGIFGLEEDSPIIGVLFGVRDAIGKTVAVAKAMFTGDFKGGAPFGIEEDSPVIGVVFGIRDAIKGAFGAAKDAVKGFVDGFGGMDSITAKVGPVLSMLAGPLGLLKTVLFDLMKGLDFKEAGSTFGAAVRPIVDAVLQLWGVVGQAATGIASELIPVVADIAKTLLPILSKVLGDIGPVFSKVVAAVVPLVGQLVSQLAPALAAIVAAVLPVVSELVGALAPIITRIASAVLPPLVSALATLAGIISSVVVPVIGGVLVPVINILGRIVATVFGFVADSIANSMRFIAGVIKTVTSVIAGDWSGAWNGIKQMASAVWDQIKNLVRTGINLVKDTVLNAMGLLTGNWSAKWEDILSIGTRVWGRIKESAIATFGAMVDGIGKAWNGIKRIVATPINAVIRFVNEGIVGAYNSVAGFLGVGKMGRLDSVSGFQGGGYIDRPWSSTNRDPYLGVLPSGEPLRFEGEEFIVNRRETRKHRGLLEDINAGRMVGAYATGGRVKPVMSGTSGNTYSGHTGLDFPAPRGATVRATADGTILRTPRLTGSYGNHVVQSIAGSVWKALYAHLSSIGVSPGQSVSAGQPIGGVGNTGNSRGNHLHFEAGPRLGSTATVGTTRGWLSGASAAGGGSEAEPVSIWATIGGKIAEGFKTVTDWIGGVMSKVTAPLQSLAGEIGRSPFGKLVLSLGDKIKDDLTGWITGKTAGSTDAESIDDKPKRGYANGTRHAMPGLARVGEGRSEIIDFRGGERVYSPGESDRLGANRRSGITINELHVHAALGSLADLESLIDGIAEQERFALQLGA